MDNNAPPPHLGMTTFLTMYWANYCTMIRIQTMPADGLFMTGLKRFVVRPVKTPFDTYK